MGRETTYCDHCGRWMDTSEVNMCYYKHECGCGNIFTSHDPSYHKRIKEGKKKHIKIMEEDLARAETVLEERKAKGEDVNGVTGFIEEIKKEIAELRSSIERFGG